MQPYQLASEESNKQSYRPLQAAGVAAIPLAKAAFGGKIMSLINKHIPEGLALKGLSKLDPRLGKFMALGQELGHSYDELKSFLGEKVEKGEEQQKAKDSRNIIEKESPELHQFISNEVKKGVNPIKASAAAYFGKKYEKAINNLEKQHKMKFQDIVRQIYGEEESALPKKGFAQEETERFQNQYGNQVQGQQEGSDAEFAQLIQQGNAILQKYRGK